MRGRGDIWETAISETRNFQQVQENHKTGRGNSPFSRTRHKSLIQLDLSDCWWRRRESNPRPKSVGLGPTTRLVPLWFSPPVSRGTGGRAAIPWVFDGGNREPPAA